MGFTIEPKADRKLKSYKVYKCKTKSGDVGARHSSNFISATLFTRPPLCLMSVSVSIP